MVFQVQQATHLVVVVTTTHQKSKLLLSGDKSLHLTFFSFNSITIVFEKWLQKSIEAYPPDQLHIAKN